jgi:MerR family mercuric resistance operon transcriptional regulator
MREALRIGEAAREAGVNIQTLRYYERRKLLPRPDRTETGYRLFSSEAVRHVRFIKKAQALGFSLEEIRDLIAVSRGDETTCADVRGFVRKKLAAIDERIRQLRAIRKALQTLTDACPGSGKRLECPILSSLEER